MANPLKIKRLKLLAEALQGVSKDAAWDLISMIESLEQKATPKTALLRESLPSALNKVAEKLNGYNWCLAGGLAVVHWIQTRVTYDVDCLVFSDQMEKLNSDFEGMKKGNLGFSTRIDNVVVDFLDSSLFPYADEAIKTAVIQSELGVSVPVMKPEFLVLFKLDSMREKDNQDAFGLLRLQGVPDKARKLVRKYKPQMIDDLEQAISIANLEI